MVEEAKCKELLQKDSFSDLEIESILAWLKDIEQGNVLTAEEVYASLCDKTPTYA